MENETPIPANSWRFYRADNCNRLIQWGSFQFEFQPYDCIGGSWCGLFATDDTGKIAALDGLVKTPGTAVFEVSEAEFMQMAKKKERAALAGYNPFTLPALKQTLPAMAIRGTGNARVVESALPYEPQLAAKVVVLDSKELALDVGNVAIGQKLETQ